MSQLTFTAPPPGLGPVTNFNLDAVEGVEGLFILQSGENPDVGMYLLDSARYMPDYRPVITDQNLTELTLGADEKPDLLLVAQTGGEAITVNLMAPILVNTHLGVASQVILDGEGYPVRAVLGALV